MEDEDSFVDAVDEIDIIQGSEERGNLSNGNQLGSNNNSGSHLETPTMKVPSNNNSFTIEDEDDDDDDDGEVPVFDDDLEGWQQMKVELIQVEECLRLFMNSQFNQAEKILDARQEFSIYHSVGLGLVRMIKSLFTFDQEDIKLALETMRLTIERAKVLSPKTNVFTSISRNVTGVSLKSWKKMTTVERHATLIGCEAVILKALLVVIADPSTGFVTVIKEAMAINQSYLSLKQAEKLVGFSSKKKQLEKEAKSKRRGSIFGRRGSNVSSPATSEGSSPTQKSIAMGFDPHFTSGIALGVGIFNTMFSLLPEKVTKLFEFIGFSGNRKYAMEILTDNVFSIDRGIRSDFCAVAALLYQAVIGPHLMTNDFSIELSDRLLERELLLYPESFLLLYFMGHVCYIKGDIEGALVYYNKTLGLQTDWKNLRHILYWEMMQSNLFLLRYEEGLELISYLAKESKWSTCMYTYLKACHLYTLHGATEEVKTLYGQVQGLRKKIGGKSIPIEKFVARKARKFNMQGDRICMPLLELMFIWNGIRLMSTSNREKLRISIQNELDRLLGMPEAEKKRYLHWEDDRILLMLGVGMTFLGDKSYEKAGTWFKDIIDMEKTIILDHWMAPFTRVQYCMTLVELNRYDEAYEQVKLAKKYKNYSLENTMQVRIQNCLSIISEKTTLPVNSNGNVSAELKVPSK